MAPDAARFTTPAIPVFYATTEGQTARIAAHLAAYLRDAGLQSRAIDVAGLNAGAIDWSGVRAVIVGASLHAGTHQRDVDAFVRAHVDELNRRPSVFVSVSLSAASSHAEERAEARRIAETFVRDHDWTPQEVATIAGRIAYTQYGWLKRLMMKRIAQKEGGPTDTSRDHELTNWNDVEDVARHMASTLRPPAPDCANCAA